MRTRNRLKGLQKWMMENLCQGREMKAPAPDMDIRKIVRQEPNVYIAWYPTRPNANPQYQDDTVNVCPGILIMPAASKVKDMVEQRFDRYNNVHRPKEMGQTLSVSILFSVYEPGIRLPGFIDDPKDPKLLLEGTEEGLFTLTDWMDEFMEKLLGVKNIPGTDLSFNESSGAYSLYTDQSFVVDKRPIYYGIINVEFNCYASEGQNRSVDEFLT